MKLVALETLRPAVQPNVTLLRLRTDTGLVGIGEAFFAAGAVETYLHEQVAPVLLGWDDPTPEAAAARLAPYVGFQGGGVETRALGAVDLALWDLLGRRAGLPVVDLLGGAVRESIPIYNTCAGSGYVGSSSRQESGNWGLDRATAFEDLEAFLHRPAELAKALHAEGIPGMKVWPFDIGAEKTGGTDILPADLEFGLAVARAIREAVPSMQLMIELHGLWNLKTAVKICRALEPLEPFWVEDPIRPDAVEAVARLKQETSCPLALGETVVGRRGVLPLLQQQAVDVITADVQWTGGVTEARKIASLADAFGVPVAPHDCTGPVTFAACAHLVMSNCGHWRLPNHGRDDAGARAIQDFLNSMRNSTVSEADVERFRCLLGDCAGGRSPSQAPHWNQWVRYRNSLRGLHTIGAYQGDPPPLRGLTFPTLVVNGAETVAFHRAINAALVRTRLLAEALELPGSYNSPASAPDYFAAEWLKFHRRAYAGRSQQPLSVGRFDAAPHID